MSDIRKPDPQKQISPERKAMYYGGMALSGVGFLLFISNFFTFGSGFGSFEQHGNMMQQMACTGVGGMLLMIGGGALMNIGLKGWAGSGIILDPEQARKDMEPLNRMGGGMAQDALSEVEVVKKLEKHLDGEPAAQTIKVRCRGCQALNDEDAKFCKQCGGVL